MNAFRFFILLYFIPYSSYSFANEKNKSKHIQAGINFSPILPFEENFKPDSYKFSNSIGLNVIFKSEKGWGILTGLQLTSIREGFQLNFPLRDIDPSTSNPLDTTITKISGTETNHYLETPLLLNYSFGKAKIRFNFNLGFIASFRANYKLAETVEHKNGSSEYVKFVYSDFYNRWNINSEICFGVDKNTSDDYGIRIESFLRYQLLNDDVYSWLTGINFILYRIIN